LNGPSPKPAPPQRSWPAARGIPLGPGPSGFLLFVLPPNAESDDLSGSSLSILGEQVTSRPRFGRADLRNQPPTAITCRDVRLPPRGMRIGPGQIAPARPPKYKAPLPAPIQVTTFLVRGRRRTPLNMRRSAPHGVRARKRPAGPVRPTPGGAGLPLGPMRDLSVSRPSTVREAARRRRALNPPTSRVASASGLSGRLLRHGGLGTPAESRSPVWARSFLRSVGGGFGLWGAPTELRRRPCRRRGRDLAVPTSSPPGYRSGELPGPSAFTSTSGVQESGPPPGSRRARGARTPSARRRPLRSPRRFLAPGPPAHDGGRKAR